MREWVGLASAKPRREFSRDHQGYFLFGRSLLTVWPVRKVHHDARHMITVGRTATNDLVLADRTVSRLHAWFRDVAGRVELADAGSRCGTRVNGQPLEPGETVRLYGGESLRFGSVELTFVDASGCWEYLRHSAG